MWPAWVCCVSLKRMCVLQVVDVASCRPVRSNSHLPLPVFKFAYSVSYSGRGAEISAYYRNCVYFCQCLLHALWSCIIRHTHLGKASLLNELNLLSLWNIPLCTDVYFFLILFCKLAFLWVARPWQIFSHLLFQLPESLRWQPVFGFSFSSLAPCFLQSDCRITSCLRKRKCKKYFDKQKMNEK